MIRSLRLARYIFVIGVFSLVSCSSQYHSSTKTPRDYGLVVDIGKLPTSSLEISGNNSVGPTISRNDDSINAELQKKQDVIALILGPGGNRTAGHVAFIKAIEQKNLKVHIVTGIGLGAVVATLYAAGRKSDRIEWFFYKLFNKIKKFTPYTVKWHAATVKMLREEFGSKYLEELPLATVIPLYDTKEERIHYFSRGPIVELLMENLKLSNTRGNRFISAFQWQMHPVQFLKSYGADKIIGVNVLGNEVLFLNWNDYLLGVFGKAMAMSRESSLKLDYSIDLPTDELPIDSVKEIPLFIQKSYDIAYDKVEHYIKNMTEKEENMSGVIPALNEE